MIKKLLVWLKKNWKALGLTIAFPLGLLVLLTKLFRPRVTATSFELSGHAELEKRLGEKTESKKKELKDEHTKQVVSIQEDYDKTIAKSQEIAMKKAESLKDDPIQLNDYLKRVGKDVRKPRN